MINHVINNLLQQILKDFTKKSINLSLSKISSPNPMCNKTVHYENGIKIYTFLRFSKKLMLLNHLESE